TDPAGQVEQHQVGAATPDLEAEGEGAVRVQRYRDRRVTDAPPPGVLPPHHTLRPHPPDDGRDGLRPQPRQPPYLPLGKTAMAPDQRQRQPLVVEADTALIGAARRVSGPERPRRRPSPAVRLCGHCKLTI